MEIRQPNKIWKFHDFTKESDIITMTLDQKGNLYVVDWMNSLIKRISPDGRCIIYGMLPDQTYHKIWQITVDSRNHVYMCDSDRSIIYRMAPDGSVYDFLNLPHPGSIAVDSLSNMIYVTCDGCVLRIETKEYDGPLRDRPIGKFYDPDDKYTLVTDPQYPIIVPKTIVRYAGPFSQAVKCPTTNIIPITPEELSHDFSAWWNFNSSALIGLATDNKSNIYIITQLNPECEKQVLHIIPPQGKGTTLAIKCSTDDCDKTLIIGPRDEIYHNVESPDLSYVDTIEIIEPTPGGKYRRRQRRRLSMGEREIRALGFDLERERLYIVHDKAEIPSLEMLCLGILQKYPRLYRKHYDQLLRLGVSPDNPKGCLPVKHQHKRQKTSH